MPIIATVCRAMVECLTVSEAEARQSGFCQRRSNLDATSFVRGVTCAAK